mgnify:CR=1 FL=1
MPTNDGEFGGARVVITGAAGIHGAWIAEAFARQGARLLLSDVRAAELGALAARLAPSAAEVIEHATDLTDRASLAALVALVREGWSAPDILVNNAGVYPREPLLGLPTERWDRVLSINLTAPFILTRDMAELMIGAGVRGAIVNITSSAAQTTSVGSGHYSASKAGLAMITRAFALELAPAGIRVNAVSPGFAAGSAVSPLSDDYARRMVESIPLGRPSGPHDASEAVLFLCSDRASFITGSTLSVDGGRSAGAFPLRA